MTWAAPTFADTGAAGPCLCEACGRSSRPDMLFDLQAIDASLWPRGKRYVCDACRATLFREGVISKADYLTAVGAPPALIARLSDIAGG